MFPEYSFAGWVVRPLWARGKCWRATRSPRCRACFSVIFLIMVLGLGVFPNVRESDAAPPDRSSGEITAEKNPASKSQPQRRRMTRPAEDPALPVPKKVQILNFRINNGAALIDYGADGVVTLNSTVSGDVTHYRAVESTLASHLVSQPWKPYAPAPTFQLSPGSGPHTIQFQVKGPDLPPIPTANVAGVSSAGSAENRRNISNVKSDTIVRQSPPQVEHRIWAGEAAIYAGTKGYKFQLTRKEGRCYDVDTSISSRITLLAGFVQGLYRAECEWELFAGKQLADGWTFLDISGSAVDSKVEWKFTQKPSSGSKSAHVKVEVNIVPADIGSVSLQQIVLEGPKDADWRDAFR